MAAKKYANDVLCKCQLRDICRPRKVAKRKLACSLRCTQPQITSSDYRVVLDQHFWSCFLRFPKPEFLPILRVQMLNHVAHRSAQATIISGYACKPRVKLSLKDLPGLVHDLKDRLLMKRNCKLCSLLYARKISDVFRPAGILEWTTQHTDKDLCAKIDIKSMNTIGTPSQTWLRPQSSVSRLPTAAKNPWPTAEPPSAEGSTLPQLRRTMCTPENSHVQNTTGKSFQKRCWQTLYSSTWVGVENEQCCINHEDPSVVHFPDVFFVVISKEYENGIVVPGICTSHTQKNMKKIPPKIVCCFCSSSNTTVNITMSPQYENKQIEPVQRLVQRVTLNTTIHLFSRSNRNFHSCKRTRHSHMQGPLTRRETAHKGAWRKGLSERKSSTTPGMFQLLHILVLYIFARSQRGTLCPSSFLLK